MKELTTTKPLVLGLIGLPGAGKSHFAQEFSKMFGAPVIEADLLRRSLFGDSAVPKNLESGMKTAYWALADELFKSKKIFVLDGHLDSYAGRGDARARAKKAGYDIMWLWLQTSESVAEDRATKRKRGATNTLHTTETFARALGAFEPPRPSEPHVVTSGQRTFSSQVRPVLKKIAEGHEARLGQPKPDDRPASNQPRPRRNIFIR